ncbi:hypothetical protein QZH41_010094, partial [Actinostola sp. cb2023]
EERSSPRRTKLEKKSKLEEMRESLEALQLEEQELNEAAREHDMAQQIKEKRATIEELRRRNTASPLQPQPYNLNPTPLDELLRAADQAEAGQLPPQLGSSTNHPIAQLLHDGSTPKQTISEMFLKPARGCDARDPGLAKQLETEISEYRTHLFAESTKSTYKTHRNTFLNFCTHMGYQPVPLQHSHLLQYAAFLARILKPSSIRSYLNIIGILHKEFGLPNPLLDNWALKSLLTGINRVKGSPPQQKLPITPAILMDIHSTLCFTNSLDSSFWAICLVAFFGMFRKSHLVPLSTSKFDPGKQLTKADFKIFSWGILIVIRWSKTIQFREREVKIPIPLYSL